MTLNVFHQNFYLKNTLSLRIIRKNDVHSNGTNTFYRLLLKMPNMPLQATGYLALVAFVKLTSKLVSLTHC